MADQLRRRLSALRTSLKREVLPHVGEDYARGQLLSALYLLEELELKAGDPSARTTAARERLDALGSRIGRLAQEAGLPAPPPGDQGGSAEDALRALIAWVRSLPDPAARPIRSAIRSHLMAEIEDECRLTPKPNFGEISGGVEKT